MEREESLSKDKWDLTELFKTQQDWDKEYAYLDKEVEKFSLFKGKLKSKEILNKLNEFSEVFSRRFMKLYLYAYLGHDVDLKNSTLDKDLSKLTSLGAKQENITAYIEPEMASLSDEFLNDLVNDKEFKDYKLEYISLIKDKKHILSEKEEQALAITSAYDDGFSDIYDTIRDTDMTFDSFKVDDKTYEMTDEKYGAYMNYPDRRVREKAYHSLYKSYKTFAHTIAKIYINHVKMESSDLKLRNYGTYLSATLDADEIPESVYYKLIEKVDENLPVMKEYYKLLSKETGINDFKFYDSYISISSMHKKFDHETQKKIVKEALAVLGKEYQGLLQQAYDNNWIDVYPSNNKSGGGYQFGSYDTHPYVFLNNTDDYNSMSTLAHELGHAMHSYYSNHNQPYPTSQYAIYVAEVASTVNEILLNKYMYNNSESIDDKIFFLDQYIKQIKSTVTRQTMFSEFEEKIHSLVENEEPVDLETLNSTYHNLLEKHFGGVIDIDENIDYEWLRIPHFYTAFYVYKYATSYTTANYIATCILENKNNMKEKYFTLLKSGSSDWPNELLKKVGVDLSSDEPYDILFNDLENAISKLKELLKEKHLKENQTKSR